MEQFIQIRCKNNKKTLNVSIGSTLSEIFSLSGLQMDYGPISARVNNKVEGMHFRVYKPKVVEFLSLHDASAHRAYTRSLFFVLCKAVRELYPHGHVIIDIPVSNGYHCDLDIGHPVTTADIDAIRRQMQQYIDRAIPIHRHEVPTDEAIRMFRASGASTKAKLLEGSGTLYTTYYEIDGFDADHHVGALSLRAGAPLRRRAATHPLAHRPLHTGPDGEAGQDVRHL